MKASASAAGNATRAAIPDVYKRQYCDRAANMGYDVYIENHWATMCVASELKKVMDACAHPNLGVLAHLGRWFKGDTLEAEKLIAPYTLSLIHI